MGEPSEEREDVTDDRSGDRPIRLASLLGGVGLVLWALVSGLFRGADGALVMEVGLPLALGTALTAYALRRFLKAVLLGWADRLAGAAMGVFGALLIGAALTVPLTAMPPREEPILANSLLAPYSLYAADVVRYLVPDELERQYREKSRELRRRWAAGE